MIMLPLQIMSGLEERVALFILPKGQTRLSEKLSFDGLKLYI